MYEGEFACREDIERDFGVSLGEGVEILYASYELGDWSGTALVIFIENNKLYEVSASHCSCHGLCGEWEPDEISVEYLRYVREHGTKFHNLDVDSLIERLG